MIKKIKRLLGTANNKIVVFNTLGAFVVKGASLMVSLITTPAYIRYFDNNEVLGIWYTMLSVLLWFLNFDLGIGNGIRNRLVRDFSAKDTQSARVTVSSGMFMSALVSLALLLLGAVLIFLVDLQSLYNIEATIVSYRALLFSTICVFVAIVLRFFLTTVSAVFYALQQSSVNNFLHLCSTILQLVFVLVMDFGSPERNLVALSLSYIAAANLPTVIGGFIIFAKKLKDSRPSIRYIEKERARSVMNVGMVFFACQIFYMLLINSNEVLITSLYDPAYTTEYSFYHKLTTLVSTVVTLTMAPLWSVVTKAQAEGDFRWLWKLYSKLKWFGWGAVLLQFAFVPFMQIVMDVWLSENTIQVNYVTALIFAFFSGTFLYSGVLSAVTCGLARMRVQMICYGGGTVLKFVLAFVLQKMGLPWYSVVLTTGLVLLPYCVAQQIALNRYIRSKMQ
ncbi:MAG: hypothetical protein E7552_02665 [Ruminococcaceae bacterium]|nr:hypothetical protein [Oscillospiraceae bacterium]